TGRWAIEFSARAVTRRSPSTKDGQRRAHAASRLLVYAELSRLFRRRGRRHPGFPRRQAGARDHVTLTGASIGASAPSPTVADRAGRTSPRRRRAAHLLLAAPAHLPAEPAHLLLAAPTHPTDWMAERAR